MIAPLIRTGLGMASFLKPFAVAIVTSLATAFLMQLNYCD
jgi:hypothetical protein